MGYSFPLTAGADAALLGSGLFFSHATAMKVTIATVMAVMTQAAFAAPLAPPSTASLSDWTNSFDASAPGMLSADSLLDAPAGGRGFIVVRGGHFYSGDRRVRLWGVNFAFGANFPSHDQADAVSRRLARFGINAVRLHHMDNQPFPNGIFADLSLTTLSPQALDRLDYLIAALKSRGIWVDINLHVSRNYASLYPETRNGKAAIDKLVDLFDPVLIDSQKRYAHELLTHVNAYTHNRYADEPSVALVEINNENSLFMWDAKEKLADLPAPYDAELRERWNRWLLNRYQSREQLEKAWSGGAEPIGKQMLTDDSFSTLPKSEHWWSETHEQTQLKASCDRGVAVLDVSHVDGTPWHVQFLQTPIEVTTGRCYTVSFKGQASKPVKIDVSVGAAHSPWNNLGLANAIALTTGEQSFSMTFVATENDDKARLCFAIGANDATVRFSKPFLAPGGVLGLNPNEDPATGSVAMLGTSQSGTHARRADWYTFLEETEADYYRAMFDYVHHDLGVKCPVTGTIAFGLAPLKAQLGMDFIDAHAYWDHPQFPHRPWDPADWLIQNKPMVDSTEHNALFSLAGYRVAGKPFTVTEYNHAAPNEWQAECVPMIASYAAAQDWDGVFLFAYSHSSEFDKPIMKDFFNVEGNPLKMPLVPMGARLFLGSGVGSFSGEMMTAVVPDSASGAQAVSADIKSLQLRSVTKYTNEDAVDGAGEMSPTLLWTSKGVSSNSGRYTVVDAHASLFVGFAAGALPIDLGMMSIRSMDTPFATLILTASDGHQKLKDANRLLLTTVARAENADMGWNATRNSVGSHWGERPELIERVVATVQLSGHWSQAHALDPTGMPTADNLAKPAGEDTEIVIGKTAAQAYAIDR